MWSFQEGLIDMTFLMYPEAFVSIIYLGRYLFDSTIGSRCQKWKLMCSNFDCLLDSWGSGLYYASSLCHGGWLFETVTA